MCTKKSVNHIYVYIYTCHKILSFVECPPDFPYLEVSKEKNHGDVCRESKDNRTNLKCPNTCTQILPSQAPWCSFPSSRIACRVQNGNRNFGDHM